MIGIWYTLRGNTPAHWHEHVQRPDGTAFWAAISRCGMHRVVPSVLADIEAWRAQHPDAPDFAAQWSCATCRKLRTQDALRRARAGEVDHGGGL
jgi:hypothetical protein